MYAYFAGAGFNIIPEDISSKGRADLTVIVEDKVYLFEFKVRDENPIKQIKEKRYYEKYLNNKSIYAIGIIFDNVERNIKNLKIEKNKIKSYLPISLAPIIDWVMDQVISN